MSATTCWWHRSPPPGNLGDVLNPVLLAALGLPVEWGPRGSARMIAIGSVIDTARSGTVVWGSGAMSVDVSPSPDAHYLAVRGPITAEMVRRGGGECPEIYGDPALLLPEFHRDPVAQIHDLGWVAHYVDESPPNPGTHEISPLSADPLVVVDEIRSCCLIASSSLHGLVVAQAYGIPWAWRPCAALKGDGTKFRDFAASVGVDLRPNMFSLGLHDPIPLLTTFEALKGALS